MMNLAHRVARTSPRREGYPARPFGASFCSKKKYAFTPSQRGQVLSQKLVAYLQQAQCKLSACQCFILGPCGSPEPAARPWYVHYPCLL